MTDDVFIRIWQQLFHSIIDQILSGNKHTTDTPFNITISSKLKTNSDERSNLAGND